MFHPYSVQAGTATLDPQMSGMNGQSRMPDINTFPPNYGVVGQIPGYPTPIQYGFPTGYQTTPFGTPAAFGMPSPVAYNVPTTLGWNCIPSGYPVTGAYPNVNPYAAYANPYSPYANVFNPMSLCNPFVQGVQPIVNTWNPYGTTPSYAGLNPLAAATCCPTPASFVNPSLGYHPFMTTPFVTPFGSIPGGPTPWAPYSFRNGTQFNAYQPSFCGIPATTITGHAAIDSAILSSCCTPNVHPNFTAQSPVTLSNIHNPFAAINPFATTPFNASMPTGWNNPVLNSFNPLFYNTSCLTDPYNMVRSTAYNACGTVGTPFFGGFNGSPWNWSNVWNQFQTPGLGWNTGVGFNTGYHNAFHTGAVNPIAAMATATGTPIGPISNPFFNPTNIAHGIPGFSTNVVNPLGTGVCGPVCCN